MEASSTMVIKVKYGDMLRRFNAEIVEEDLNLSMDGLRKKILSLFSLAPDTELMLTYIDEDGDVVTLVDNDDLHDVVKQALNPLRITIKVNGEKNGRQYNCSTPLRSPGVQQPLQNLNTGVSELLRTVPEPLRETLVKLSADLVSKVSSSAPGITELVDHLSKVRLSYLGQLSEDQPRAKSSMQDDVPESSTAARETNELFKVGTILEALSNVRSELSSRNNESLDKLKPEVTMGRDAGESVEKTSFGYNHMVGLDSQNMNVVEPGGDSSQKSELVCPESDVASHRMGRKEKVKKITEFHVDGKTHLTTHQPPIVNNVEKFANNTATGKEVNNPTQPKLAPNTANLMASDRMGADFVDDTRSGSPDGFRKFPGSTWLHGPGSSNSPGFISGPTPMVECPFSGIALGNVSAAPPHPTSEAVPFRRSVSQNDGSWNIFHRGVRCDGCGVHPIAGPRFKSKVKVDYDLCSICFEKMGNYSDYIRMDRPAIYRHHMSFKGCHDARGRDRGPTLPQVCRGLKAKLDSRFIQDVNVMDGTAMAPLTPFTKIWRMRNNGTAVWPQKTQLVWIGGDKLSHTLSVEVEIPAAGLLIDQELDVAVDFVSPGLPGRYISYWRMASPSGQKFGQRVWVLIQVDASVKETPRESIRNLNLNLPPVSSCLTGPEIINVDSEPTVEERQHPEPDNSKRTVELVQQNMTEQELKFPINDSLLVGNGASTSLPTSAGSSVSYPNIDLADVGPALPSVLPTMLYPLPQPTSSAAPVPGAKKSAVDLPGKKQVEEELLRELDEMGFKQVDLNKEVLRTNEYDLEQSVDHLCGIAEWDPILEELQEMGFHDTEMNKMLLKKNNGSIKRVVMDLIAGEKM
ncbi:protein NBR1 homolog [Sesamum indicum]|uniref:Protein NBR1 homolog n=1 Tax=Sesamum indicum TaxID=4182 RepID=A0A6I9UHV9_SESIN|nr:protein NBR1 homolog [Sesamum indicum]